MSLGKKNRYSGNWNWKRHFLKLPDYTNIRVGLPYLKKKQQKSENKTCSVKQGAKSTLNPHTTTLEICQYYVELDENNQK